jgi:hypothetical protein
VAEPLRVLNSCRIRWGRVQSIHNGLAEVVGRPLEWDGRALRLGPSRVEPVACATADGSLAPTVNPGDVVAVHWDWVCDVLSPARLDALRSFTLRILRMTNEALRRPVAAAVLD